MIFVVCKHKSEPISIKKYVCNPNGTRCQIIIKKEMTNIHSWWYAIRLTLERVILPSYVWLEDFLTTTAPVSFGTWFTIATCPLWVQRLIVEETSFTSDAIGGYGATGTFGLVFGVVSTAFVGVS